MGSHWHSGLNNVTSTIMWKKIITITSNCSKCVDGLDISERVIDDAKEKFKVQIEKNQCHVFLGDIGNADDPVIVDKMVK